MSDSTSSGSSASQETLRAAGNAVGSAAEQIKATASGAYDAGAKASQYVGSTASEHPLTTLLITAGVAYLAGALSSRSRSGSQSWRDSADAIRRQVQSAASSIPDATSYARGPIAQSARDAADYVTQGAQGATDYVAQNARGAGDYAAQSARSAGGYVTRGTREYPVSVLLGAAVVSGVLGYLFRDRSG